MDRHSAGQPDAVAGERLERLASHLRSPIAEDRVIELVPLDPDRPSLEIPPTRELIRPLGWMILAAIAGLVVQGWQLALVGGAAALLLRQVDRRVSRAKPLFTDGFLRFRDDARAQGVQEEDDVRWTWSDRGADGRAGGSRPPVVARIDQPLTAPPVMPRTK